MVYWWVVQLVIALAMIVVGELIRPKQAPPNAKPSAFGDFNFPTATEDRKLPVFWGTVKIEGPNVTWYGDVRVVAIKKKVKTGLWSSKKVVVGFKYYLGVELCFGHGDATVELQQIRFGGNRANIVQAEQPDGTIAVFINDEWMFGGPDKEGGVLGTARFYRGGYSHGPNAYMEGKLGKLLPYYHGLCRLVLEGVYLGTSAYIKPIGIVVKRVPNTLGLTGGKHDIEGDANAAAMIHEILTDQSWGCALDSALTDTPGLRRVGDTLFAEKTGLSLIAEGSQSDGQTLISEILRHVDGTLYTDPRSAVITVALARKDYNVDDLLVLDVPNVSKVEISRGQWSETRNAIRLTYTDRAQDFSVRTVQAQDLANFFARGNEVAVEEIELSGLSNATAARNAVERALKAYAFPLARIKVTTNRTAWPLHPASVFKLTWAPLKLQQLVCRVARIDYGEFQSNQIVIDCVEDIFSIDRTIYALPPPSGWVDPLGQPVPLLRQIAFETPYQLQDDANRRVTVCGTRANGLDDGFETWHQPPGSGALTRTGSVQGFAPSALLRDPYPATTAATDSVGTALVGAVDLDTIEAVSDTDFSGGAALALIRSAAGDELVAWQRLTQAPDGSWAWSKILRGAFDTLPLAHEVGALVFFISEGMHPLSETPYPANGTVGCKLPTVNIKGVLPLANAAQINVLLNQRAARPYPPGNVRINNQTWPTLMLGDAAISWAHRNRAAQASRQEVVAQDAGSVPEGPEGTITVRIYVGGTLRQTYAGLAGTTQTYPAAQRQVDDTDGNKPVTVRLTPVYGALEGPSPERTFVMRGFGMQFGLDFGGTIQ